MRTNGLRLRSTTTILAAALVVAATPFGAAGADSQRPIDAEQLGLGVFDNVAATLDVLVERSAAETSLALSRARFADGGARYAVLARDDVFADAMTASGLTQQGPLLLVPVGATLGDPAAVADNLSELMLELARVLPVGAPVYIIGGPGAIPDTVDALVGIAALGDVQRLAGSGRIETSIVVGTAVVVLRNGGSHEDIVAAAEAVMDAILAGNVEEVLGEILSGAVGGVPLDLPDAPVDPDAIDCSDIANEPDPLCVDVTDPLPLRQLAQDAGDVNGPIEDVVDGVTGAQAPSLKAGDVGIARAFGPGGDPVATASWADSISAGPWAAGVQAPIVLTDTESLHPLVGVFLTLTQPDRTIVLGGAAAVGDAAYEAVPGTKQRVGGADRVATAAAIDDQLIEGTGGPVLVIDGRDPAAWAYGLTAAGNVAASGGSILYADDGTIRGATSTARCDGRADVATIGATSLIDVVAAALSSC